MKGPAAKFIDAIRQLNAACDEMGIGRPTVIGMRTALAVNGIEDRLKKAGHADKIRPVQGGFEIEDVAIKVRWN